ncbi:MAG: ABC transporter ATP-binding protein [Planctomycetes bacterium]|nr:ABC transporter ATP-binding protein [Planctomycetota bacterium]
MTKSYRDVTALDDCTLGVERGEVFGLLGPNGAGKTTLLRLLMGFLKPTSGKATIDGLDCYRESVRVHRAVSYLPGEARLFRRMRGKHVLKFFAGIRQRGNLKRALDLADRLELDTSRRVAMMSTGMRQKLALAATMSVDVPLMILDEPTANLDPTVRGTVLELVNEARSDRRTVIFSSHVLSEVEEVCDRVGILREGQLVHMQVMHELRKQHRILARVVGELPDVPESLHGQLLIEKTSDGRVTIETAGELVPAIDAMDDIIAQEVAGESEENRRAAGRGKRMAFRTSHAQEWGEVILESFGRTVAEGLKLSAQDRPAVGGTKWPAE